MIESVFKVPERKNTTSKAQSDAQQNGGTAAASSRSTAQEKEEVIKPKVLDQQRCTVIEIIQKRVGPVEMIKNAVRSADLDFLSSEMIAELLSLFPAKTFEEEKKKLLDYKPGPADLSRPEQFLYQLMSIPDIRQKLSTLNFCLEFSAKKADIALKLEVVEKALSQLKADKVKRIFQTLLAIGNLLNNSKTEIKVSLYAVSTSARFSFFKLVLEGRQPNTHPRVSKFPVF